MWYPSLSDVIRIYERVSPKQDGRVRDERALDRMIMAPQHAAEDHPTKANLAGKTSAMIIAAVEAEPFTRRTEEAALAVGAQFLDRNGATLQASLNGMQGLLDQISEGMLEHETFKRWIKDRTKMQTRQESAKRILGAVSRISQVIEEIEQKPDAGRHAQTLENAGNAICTEVNRLIDMQEGKSKLVEEGYPAVYERWKSAFGA